MTNIIAYDSDLRPTGISVPNVESLAFTYDAANRITQITNGLDSGLTQSLGYDAVNRLTSVSSGVETGSFSYDADGNRTSQIVNGTAATFNYATTSNRLASVSNGTTYGYNAEGDTTTINGTTAYQYGPFDRLANAGGESYRTSAEGQRIFKQGASGTTYFAPDASGTPMAEYQSQVGAWQDYVWLNGRLVTLMTSTGAVYSVHADQTGRPLAMTNQQNQSTIWQASNLPFGHRAVSLGTWFDFNLGFPGQYYDSESGLSYNGNRDYNANTGRYIESDPIGLAGGVNTYAYVGDNPITHIDPLGLCDQQKCTQASAVVAALGQALSSTGSAVTWTGIGITSASVLGGIFVPEGAELEVEGGIDGVSMITAGSRLSALGGVLTGYAANGFAGAVENGLAAAVLDKFDEGVAGLALPEGTSEAATHAVAGVLGEASDAVLAEQAACVGH